MKGEVVSLNEKYDHIKELWSPHIVSQMNDYHIKLARIQGEFIWHSHSNTDEVFLVLAGEMKILLRDKEVSLKEGDLYVVPKGVEHKPVTIEECKILLIEHATTINTGDENSDRRKDSLPWI